MANAVQFAVTDENKDDVLAAAEAAKNPPVEPKAPEEEPKADPPKDPNAPPVELEIPEKPEVEPDAPLDLAPYYTEYAETGALSEESRSAIAERLTKAGFANAEELIDQHMAGAKAAIETTRQGIFAHVGGEAEYTKMVQWASQNLPVAEIQKFNEAVKNPDFVEMAVTSLQAKYKAAGAAAPPAKESKHVQPNANVSQSFEPIRSDQQVAELVSDKRYLTDPGYRTLVDQRIKSSMQAGYLK